MKITTPRTRHRALLTAAAILALLLAGGVTASEQIAQREDLVCTSCHDKPGSKLLTDQGKYYELMGSVAGFAEVEATFERCTSCHVRKPGSAKLTKTGHRFAALVGDMEGLKKWAQEAAPCKTEPLPGDAISDDSTADGAAERED